MKKLVYLLIILLFVSTTVSNAQTSFRVLAKSGNVAYKVNAKTSAIVTGQEVSNEGLVVVGVNSFVGLMHNKTGRTIELKEAGNYNLSNLNKELGSKGEASLNQRYASYVFAKLTEDNKNSDASSHEDYMSVTGSVERDIMNNQIQVLLPNSSDAFPSSSTIYWKAQKGISEYKVVITDMFDKELFKTSTNKNFVDLDLKALGEKAKSSEMGEPDFFVTVYATDQTSLKSKKHLIKILDNDKFEKISKELEKLNTDNTDKSSLSFVIEGAFYEHHGLYLEALNAFNQAMKMQPGVSEYSKIYENFTKRIGIN